MRDNTAHEISNSRIQIQDHCMRHLDTEKSCIDLDIVFVKTFKLVYNEISSQFEGFLLNSIDFIAHI